MQRIASRVNAFWDRTYEYRLVKSLIGILLSNVANNSSDLVVDISAATTGSPVTINGTEYTSPNFTRNAVIDAAFASGDRASDFRAIAMHSSVFREASKNNEIELVRDSDNNILFAIHQATIHSLNGIPILHSRKSRCRMKLSGPCGKKFRVFGCS